MRGRLALLAALLAAPAAAAVDHRALVSDSPPTRLSATGLFADLGTRRLAPGVVAYTVAAALYADEAEKERAIALPPGTRAVAEGPGRIRFPLGTVLVKTFGHPADARDPASPVKALETRLLVHRADGWVALPYVWEASGREARLRRAGAVVPARFVDRSGRPHALDWQVPNVNQCKTCHGVAGALEPLGLKARNLVATGDFARLARAGLLAGAQPAEAVPRPEDATAPLDLRARAWLDANCGHCHSRQGSASNSGLFLDWDEKDRVALGIGKRPVAAGRGSGGREVAIHPGHPDRSILLFRIESTEPGVMMPELGRTLPDAQGMALIRQWIGELRD